MFNGDLAPGTRWREGLSTTTGLSEGVDARPAAAALKMIGAGIGGEIFILRQRCFAGLVAAAQAMAGANSGGDGDAMVGGFRGKGGSGFGGVSREFLEEVEDGVAIYMYIYECFFNSNLIIIWISNLFTSLISYKRD